MKLYEITGGMINLIEKYNQSENQEQLDALEAALKDMQLTFDEKALAVSHHILNVKSDIPSIDSEIERLTKLKKSAEAQVEWFEGYLKRSMEAIGTEKVQSATVKISLVKNPPSVVIDNVDLIPEKYKRAMVKGLNESEAKAILVTFPNARIDIEVDKTAIKDADKSGVGVEGVHLEQKRRLSIK